MAERKKEQKKEKKETICLRETRMQSRRIIIE